MRRECAWLWEPHQDLTEREVFDGVLALVGKDAFSRFEIVHPVLYDLPEYDQLFEAVQFECGVNHVW